MDGKISRAVRVHGGVNSAARKGRNHSTPYSLHLEWTQQRNHSTSYAAYIISARKILVQQSSHSLGNGMNLHNYTLSLHQRSSVTELQVISSSRMTSTFMWMKTCMSSSFYPRSSTDLQHLHSLTKRSCLFKKSQPQMARLNMASHINWFWNLNTKLS